MRIFEDIVYCKNCMNNINNKCILYPGKNVELRIENERLKHERIKHISSNLNNNIKQKADEQLWALNEGWKIELENKNKEIKELKEKYDKDTHTLQNQLDIANADRVEKDKIIKLMTKYIADNDTTEIFCDDDKFEIDAFGDEVDCDEDCQECVIRFFEEKVRNKYV